MTNLRGTLNRMRPRLRSTAVITALLAVTGGATIAYARRKGPTPTKHIVAKAATTSKSKPKVVAIAKTSAPAAAETAAPNPTTNDPILAGADRVVGRDRDGYVAFTFDDGPIPETTPTVLEALQKYNIPATFFIVTRHFTTWNPEHEESKKLLAQEVSLGFTIGNHTAHHANLLKVDDKKLTAEMDDAFTTLYGELGKPIGLFRAPYGHMNARARARLAKLGATEVFWSIDPRDWQTNQKDAQKLRKRVLKTILDENGGVVLMHDTRKVTASIIADVFDDLEAENCRRLAANEKPIWPVTLHYFLKDGGKPRSIPDDVAARTTAYQKALPDRCAKRAAGSTSDKSANK